MFGLDQDDWDNVIAILLACLLVYLLRWLAMNSGGP